MEQFWNGAVQLAAAGQPAVLATVMAVSGQIPAPPGARLIVTATETSGALDGGAADSVVVTLLRAGLSRGAFAARVGIAPEIAHTFGLLHGGAIELLAQPLSDFAPGMLQAVADAVGAGESVALVTPLIKQGELTAAGKPALVRNGAATGNISAAALVATPAIITAGQPVRWASGDAAAFVDVVRPAEELVILGAKLMAEALCDLAARAGFRVTLLHDAPGVQERYPSAAEIVISDDPIGMLMGRQFTLSTYLVLMSVGHKYDLTAVQQLLRKPLRYLGMMGSRARVARTVATLKEQGYTPEEIARLHAPVGLNIGAESPYEIAVSILAELIQVRRGQTNAGADWPVTAASAVRAGAG